MTQKKISSVFVLTIEAEISEEQVFRDACETKMSERHFPKINISLKNISKLFSKNSRRVPYPKFVNSHAKFFGYNKMPKLMDYHKGH